MKKLEWTPKALLDLRRLHDFLKRKNPAAAQKASLAIREGALKLSAHAHIGRPMQDGTERRELLIPFGAGNYVLRYKIGADVVMVIRVWHNREEQIH